MKDIETKLLEAEKAERQRELDEKRKSETAKDLHREVPNNIQEYLKKKAIRSRNVQICDT